MKYFQHDSSSFDDEKISELFIAFGYEGLGLFYTILEKIAKQEKPIKTSVLKHQLKVGRKLEKCWSFLETIELICSNNGETFNENILKYNEKYQIKKETTKERVTQWRERQSITKAVTRYEHECNVDKDKVIKDKVINKGSGDSIESEPTSEEMDISIKEEGSEKEKNSAEKENENEPSGLEASASIDNSQTINSLGAQKVLTQAEKFEKIVSDVFEASTINHYSDEYKQLWIGLCKTKKWKAKSKFAFELSIKQLSKYDERFGIDLMEKAISGNYQGVVFDNTDEKYQKYLSTKTLSVVHNGAKFNNTREQANQSVAALGAEASRILGGY